MRWLLVLALCAASAAAQKYTGPQPPQADLPFLVHADNLEPTEALQASEQERKDEILYTIKGANSTAKTPLASPIFLLKSEKLDPSKLQLYKVDSKNGQREILFRKKKNSARPIRMSVTRLSQENLYRIEVDESLENGEYSLTPDGTNQVFCFQVY